MKNDKIVGNQETEGLLSPFLREFRLKKVASQIGTNKVILDLASGAGYLKNHIDSNCTYYGVDYLPENENLNFDIFFNLDITHDNTFEKISEEFKGKIDIITVVAFLEHTDNHSIFFNKYSTLLKKGGKIIGTTPHPSGRLIHDLLSKVNLCSKTGAEEHNLFLNKKIILDSIEQSGGHLVYFKKFLLGLNQIFVIVY